MGVRLTLHTRRHDDDDDGVSTRRWRQLRKRRYKGFAQGRRQARAQCGGLEAFEQGVGGHKSVDCCFLERGDCTSEHYTVKYPM